MFLVVLQEEEKHTATLHDDQEAALKFFVFFVKEYWKEHLKEELPDVPFNDLVPQFFSHEDIEYTGALIMPVEDMRQETLKPKSKLILPNTPNFKPH